MQALTTLIVSLAPLAPILFFGHTAAQSDDPFIYAPDFSKDPFPPYPPLTNPDGSNITVDNLRGTRLFGWTGCEPNDQKAIAEAFDDFYKLANPLSSNIDWSDDPAQDFWGKNDGPNKVPDNRRTQIQQIFKAQQQMYAIGWHIPVPGLTWRILWIEVRCSGGDNSGDPDNVCKDLKPNDGQCGRGGTPVGGDDNTLQAYSESPTTNKKLWYSRITFCNQFFNGLPSLSDAISRVSKQPSNTNLKLDSWDNRARCFLHETTHLDYFMNAPGSSPLVDDLSIEYKQRGGGIVEVEAYGPYNCKILRNYGLAGEVAFYPQRNADSFAWFAMGSYVKQLLGYYPRFPRPNLVPVEDPKNSGGGDVTASDLDPANAQPQPPEDVVADSTDDDPAYAEGFSFPNCPDGDVTTNENNDGLASADGAPDGSSPAGPASGTSSTPGAQCDTGSGDISDIPYNVFYGSPTGSTDVFGNFCTAVDGAATQALNWTTDASGNQKTSPSRRSLKRTPPPDPSTYSNSEFSLSWSPSSSGGTFSSNCHDAYRLIAESPCGHQGSESNDMTNAANIDVGCGIYSYTITTSTAAGAPCDFSTGSCSGMDCPSGSSGQCVEDHGTGGGACQCLTTISRRRSRRSI